MSSDYEDMKRGLDESIRKDEARQKVLREKRAEKRSIKKAGGGKRIARELYAGNTSSGDGTDFEFGFNDSKANPVRSSGGDPIRDSTTREGGVEIDRRIAEEAAGRCMGRVACQVCRKFHGYCVELDEDKEKLKMLPTGNEQTSGNRGKRQGGMDWIKNEDLSTTPKEAKILMIRYNKEGRFGARVELKLAFDGRIKYWGIPPKVEGNSPNYRDLIAAFGHDENNWVDKRILLYLEKEDFGEQYFIRVGFPNKESGSRSSSTASRGSGRS